MKKLLPVLMGCLILSSCLFEPSKQDQHTSDAEAKAYEKKMVDTLNAFISDSLKKIPFQTLMTRMRVKKDDFKKMIFYTPAAAPNHIDYNWIYPYICYDLDSKHYYTRIVLQYQGEDWLFIENMQLMVDTTLHEYPLYNMSEEVLNGNGVSERKDIDCPDGPTNLINVVSNAKHIKIRWNGKEHYRERDMTWAELNAFKDIKLLYAYFSLQSDTGNVSKAMLLHKN